VQRNFVHIFQSKYVGRTIYEWNWELFAHNQGLGSTVFKTRQRKHIFLFPERPRAALWSTEPPTELVPLIFLSRKAALSIIFYILLILGYLCYKTNQLMLYREIIAVCTQIHTKHINTLCGQNIEFVTTHNTHNRQTCPLCDSNPQSQQVSSHRPTP
jgi:hypothetical protein